ncbi:heterokaryon incompatibility protein-domain-containing protein [Xylogone sp. PMI_703]|nr:heterokaryon incompatibility protein-domain-containing protein [Xylogone sp. PMI_703]
MMFTEFDDLQYWSFAQGFDVRDEKKSILKGKVVDLILRQPCSFCSLILHLVSPKAAAVSIERAREGLDVDLLQEPFEIVLSFPLMDRLYHFFSVYSGTRPTSASVPLRGSITKITPTVNLFRRFSILSQHRLGDQQVDPELVLSWIEKCNTEHHLCKHMAKEATSLSWIPIRLIDVVEMRLVKANVHTQYVALSYVWGQTDSFRTRKKDLEVLETKDGLRRYWSAMGGTIQDAISFVQSIKQRYLWADAISIVQDDPEEMMDQISHMDAIYSRSFLTLVALSAKDANSRLPGVCPGSRSTTRAVNVVQGHMLSARPSYTWNELRSSSLYDTRAWTFQESILSSRCLYFTEKRVIFQCLQDVELESSLAEEESGKPRPEHINPLVDVFMGTLQNQNSIKTSSALSDHMQSLYFYQVLVKTYTNRNLTHSSDYLNAFLGVLSMLQRMGAGPFVHGIPERSIDYALLWNSGRPSGTVRRDRDGKATKKNEDVPSWTWVGWTGPVRWDLFPSRRTDFFESDCLPSFHSAITDIHIQEETGSIRPIITQKPSQSSNLEKDTESGFTTLPPTSPSLLPPCYSKDSMPGSLFFRCPVVPLSHFGILSEQDSTDGDSLPFRFLTFSNFGICGILHCPEPFHPPVGEDMRRFQLIIVSYNREKFSHLYLVTRANRIEQKITDCMWPEWSTCNVLLVEYHHHGKYAERVGTGQIHVDALEKVKLTRRWVALR